MLVVEVAAMITVYDRLGEAKEETHGYKVKNISVPTQSEVEEYIQLFGSTSSPVIAFIPSKRSWKSTSIVTHRTPVRSP